MLTGKFWIMPERVLDLTGSEHVLIARRWILNLHKEDDPSLYCSPFHRVTGKDVCRLLDRGGIDLKGAQFLINGGDARAWAIEHYDWVRVAKGPQMNAWALNDATLNRIRGAHAYWDAQTKLEDTDEVDFYELSTKKSYMIKATKLTTRSGLFAAQVKAESASERVSA